MSAARTQGRAASCTSTKASSATSAGNASQARQHRIAALGAAGGGRAPACPAEPRCPATTHRRRARITTSPAIRGCAASRSSVCSISGRPASGRYCLGRSPPTRVPRPAAGTTHHTAADHGWPSLTAAAAPAARRRGRRRLFDHLVERLARLDQAQLGARARLHRLLAALEVSHVRGQRLVALLQALVVLGLLLRPPRARYPPRACRRCRSTASSAERSADAIRISATQRSMAAVPDSARQAGRGWGTHGGPHSGRPRPAAPRSAAAGCTWPRDRCGTASRS